MVVNRCRSPVAFLEFKLVFDVLDCQKLYDKLVARGFLAIVLSLVQSLIFEDVRARLLINSQVSAWFDWTCGVFQGSPISPWLFNLFIDDLLYEVNAGIVGIPICLFYADDAVIFYRCEC